ncbi:glucose-6-phosphate isomerase [Schlesneria paludicola]|uniref:glucose-6-phosphate isomerase n=1 Tax=Schlesneria paludicola TaxID=360056 RepID=UPI00029B0AD1|nr:glucose-6-phosphate isomerase [Schlesneria paludicola]
MPTSSAWSRFCQYLISDRELGFSLDVSRVRFAESELASLFARMTEALDAMQKLEGGAIANPDENRMVGHYWLRAPQLAPTPEITAEIQSTQMAIREFADQVHSGAIEGAEGRFQFLLLIGIGGSALGPQFVAQALGSPLDPILPFFIDNTDPDGIDTTLGELDGQLGRTLVVVISKSGGTPETRNGMLEVQKAYEGAGLSFAEHAVAVTQAGSKMDQTAQSQNWLKTFPMWDWVGGRTSVLSAVGLLPAALQGIGIMELLDGAASMDRLTRITDPWKNPAALLATMWYHIGDGVGAKDMVILPYKDRLSLFSRYLQQLVMESLGKELDRQGKTVHQGIAVYGNKGSTDQHAYIQQLRDGLPNFFATFIEVLKDRELPSMDVEPGITAGDYLHGLMLGTREALRENRRDTITITINAVTARSVGALIALYERAVGLYAELINVNAYHQPGVEAGKKAAAAVLELELKIVAHLKSVPGPQTAEQISEALSVADNVEWVYKILQHLAANPDRQIMKSGGDAPEMETFYYKS